MDMKFDKRTSEENLRKIAEGAGLEVTEEMSKDEIYNLLEAFTADETQEEEKSESDSLHDNKEDKEEKPDTSQSKKEETPLEDTLEKKKAVALKQFGGYGQYAYAGPTIRSTPLKENAVFRGSLEDVLDYLSDELEKFPEAMELIVPVNQLAQYKQKKEKRGNVVYNKYKAIASASSKKKQ